MIHTKLKVFSFFLWIILPVASASGQSASRTPDSITIALKWQHQFQFAGYYAAIEQGFFAEEGLQVTLTTPDDLRFPDVTVAAGEAEYGVSTSEILLSRVAGDPFVVVAPIFQHSPVALVSRADNYYIYPSSFVEKRLEAIGLARSELIALFQREGVNPNDVLFVEQPRDLTALVDDRVDGIIGYITDLPYQMESMGIAPRLLRPIDYGIDFYGDLLFTTETEIKNNPRRVTAVKRAVLRGWEYALENSEELIDHILTLPDVQKRGFTRELLQFEAEKTINLIQPVLVELGHINPGRWEKIAKMYADQGLMPHNFPLEGFIFTPTEIDATTQKVFRIAGALIALLLLVVVVIIIVTKFKLIRMKRKHQRTESLFRTISANFDSGYMFQVDTGKAGELRQFLFVSDGVTAITGYTPQQIVADSALMYAGIGADDMLMLLDKESEAITHEKTLCAEIKVNNINGSVRWCQITSIPHREANKHLLWEGIVLDRTEQRKSEEFRKRVFESSILPIVVMDADSFKYLDCNQAAVNMYKFNSKEEIIGKSPLDVSASFQYDGTSSETKVLYYNNEALEKGSVVFEWLHKRPDGELWDAEVHLLAFTIEGKKMLQFSLLDISDRKRAEQMLETSESRLRATLENTPNVAIQWCDIEGRIVYWNHASETLYGFNPSEAIGKTFDQLFYTHEEFLAFLSIIKEIHRTGKPYGPYETAVQLADGRQGIVLATTFGIELEPGKPGFVCMDADITELKQAEESIRISEARYRSVIAVSNTGVWEFNNRSKYLWGSPEYFKMLGRNQKDFLMDGTSNLEETWVKLLHPDDQQKAAGHFAEYLKNGSLGMYENYFRMKHANGSWVWIWSRGQTLRNPDESLSDLTVGTHINITDIKQMEKKLKIERDNFEIIYDSSPLAVLVLDESTSIIRANASAIELCGGDESLVMHHQPGDALHCTHSFEARCGHGANCPLCPIRRGIKNLIASTGGRIDKAEVELNIIRDKKEQNLWLEVSAAEILIDDQRAFIFCLNNVTDKKTYQEQLRQSQKMESVGRLAGGVAHDFNNMLGVILLVAEMAQQEIGPDDPLRANLDEIRKAAERSADLTRQLLAFARKQTVAPRVLDLNETVEGMLKMLRRLIGEDIDLAWLPGGNIGPVFIDPSQMDQILANLCVNARDAIADTGKVSIETDSASFDEDYCVRHVGFVPGEYVLLAVSDDGCGMDQETQANIFEPFFTTKEMGKGTGLGLATVHGIVKQNNGVINVYSKLGHGTTFRIYLPRHAAKAASRSEEGHASVPAVGGETILLVEDEPSLLKITKLMLERMGHAVIAAATPREVFRLAQEHKGRIDLLMTDVIMPEMNGRDLASKLMSIYPDIKSLFMSGYMSDVIARHGMLEEGVHFIQKPFSMKDLAAKTREALNG